MYLSFWLGAVVMGLGFTGLVLSAFLTFRVLNFPDLTVDGSYPLGGAVTALLIVQGMSPWLTLPVVFLAGGLAGAATGVMATRLGINGLLAGILVAIGMYSVNLHVMGGVSNLPIFGNPTVMTAAGTLAANTDLAAAMVFGALTVVVILLAYWFLCTEVGLAMRAVGDNEQMARAQGISTGAMKMVGLIIANGLAALAGALQVQYMGFADVNLGLGAILAGIAALIIGEALMPVRGLLWAIVAVAVGSIVYRLVVAFALYLGLPPNDIKLGTVAIVLLALTLPRIRGIGKTAR